MIEYCVPYGSHQPRDEHGLEFLVPWVRQLVTRSVELNTEHRAVLHKLNGLLLALDSGDPTRITMACDVLVAETRVHFDMEEAMMLVAGYPDRAAHIEQHEELLRGIARIRYSLVNDAGHWSPVSELSMLEDWFVPHLTHEDRRFANFLAARSTAGDAH